MPVDAGQQLAEKHVGGRVGAQVVDDDYAAAQFERRFDGVGQARFGAAGFFRIGVVVAADHQAIDHHFDVVDAVAVECDVFFQVVDFTIGAHALETLLADVLEDLFVLAFAPLDDRREDLRARAIRQRLDFIDDLLGALGDDFRAANGTVRDADAGVEQAQIVVDFGDSADGRARVVADALLVNRNRRTQPLNLVNVGLFHLA